MHPLRPERVEAIAQLRFDAETIDTPHTVRGVVSRVGVPLYVQDRTGGIEVTFRSPAPTLRIGDEVMVTGRLVPLRYSSRLKEAELVVLAPGVPEPPVSLTATMASSGNYDRVYVETEGVLREIRNVDGALWLVLDGGREPFVVEVPIRPVTAFASKLVLQSRLRVRGICIMDDRRSGEATPFTVRASSIEDISIISPPPFWNRAHVLEVVGGLLLIVLGIMILYVRMERWRFALILDERTRMAHDLHDTLAQSFTGIAFQLQAARNAIRAGAENIEKQVSLAIAMVSDSQEDARRSIAMLKPADLETGNVLENLRQQGEALTHGEKIVFSINSKGEIDRIPEALGKILLRIGHEAVTNALRHAHPKTIAISLEVTADSVVLIITDDGLGFATDGARARGFGIRAMHARAHSYGGSLEILSSPEKGTTVEARIPLRPKRKRFTRIFSTLREGES
ncbi:MAG: sensor histidine kinase [Acidobacteriales bacterium]|nr:sensor histidine kinase [Terriglobales bacterium]